MGMILIFFWGLYIAAAVGIYFLVKHFILNKWVHRIVLVFLILLPTYDIIITNILGAYYCNAEPNPKTFIKKKVEYPESIYWESQILKEDDRKQMVQRYLDDLHLKTMALNGDDGKVYVYHYENIPKEYYSLKKEYDDACMKYTKYRAADNMKSATMMQKKLEKFGAITRNMLEASVLKEEVYIKATMPKMKYIIKSNKIKLNTFARKFISSFETQIVDNSINDIVAYNRVYVHFWYNIMPNFSTDSLYDYSDIVCGKRISIVDDTFNIFIWTK